MRQLPVPRLTFYAILKHMEKPRLLQGFRDYLPNAMMARQHVIDTVRGVYESYGFLPLDTPVLEYADLLLGKYGEDEKLIYHFHDHGNRHVAMRYDLTVPLARVIAMYPDLPRPFKRYQVAPVWRADSPQAGRYREFMQFDVDTIGTTSPLADAEMIQVQIALLRKLGIENYCLRLNHRGVLAGVMRALQIRATNLQKVQRAIDKLEKIGKQAVAEQLLEVMNQSTVDRLFALFAISSHDELFQELHQLLEADIDALHQLENLSEIVRLATIDQHAGKVIFDLSIVRGLDYYTGIIYETTITDATVGTVLAGGRYDNLMRDLAGKDAGAVGVSLGVDRLLAALSETQEEVSRNIYAMMVFPAFEKKALDLSEELRQHGLSIALGLGSEKLGKQLQYANSIGAKAALLYGENEAAKKVILIRDLKSGEQQEITLNPIEKLVEALQKL